MGQGAHGLPGLPGGIAGHFIAIGSKFIGSENVCVCVNGGNGGAGQHGGNGSYI